MKISSFFYKVARIVNDIEKFASMDGKKWSNRIQNKWLGRNIFSKFWRR